MVYVKYYVKQVFAFKKPDILWHLTKVGRCLHVHEVHVSFFLSMLLSVKFNYDHKDRFKPVLGGVRIVALTFILMNRLNKTESAVVNFQL